MSVSKVTVLIVSAFGAGLTPFSAMADVITFSGLPGPTDSPFTSYTEGKFTVTSASGSWFQGLVYGNPAPSIYDGPVFSPGVAAINVTDTGDFTFNSVDYSSNNGASRYLIEGFLGVSMVFSQGGSLVPSLPPSFGFTTLNSGSSVLIDRLFIQVTPGGGVTSLNLDNVNVTSAVPEPFSIALLGTAVACLALGMRRQKNTVSRT
jgi:hypothetical protein